MDFKERIAEALSKAIADADKNEIYSSIEIPSDLSKGDFAFPCFKLAKVLRKAPPLIAKEISEKMDKPDGIEKIEVVNAYINFYADKSVFIKEILSAYPWSDNPVRSLFSPPWPGPAVSPHLCL